MRTVLLGTSEFAAAVLGHLARSAHRPSLAVTRPDRPSGRGRRMSPPPVAVASGELGVELYQPEKVNDAQALQRIAEERPQAVVVCAYGALIREPLLSSYEMLNIHPSLLPRWRGAAPIERAIMAGDGETGVSIMRLVAGLDSGPVCMTERAAISSRDDFGTLCERLELLGGRLIVRVLDMMERGERPRFEEQDEGGVTYAEKIEAADRLLDPARTADELDRVVRALHPHVGAQVALADGTMLKVGRAAVANASLREALAGAGGAGVAGDGAGAVRACEGRLVLLCAGGALELLEVQPPGGRPMEGAAYARGRSLPAA
ncbi:MAG: methionyl-tRNA formyltransferase [Acidobacteriota bacterium]|nr:methionyl-tRNA formyltransferase [Acidobacteriota bacterium]